MSAKRLQVFCYYLLLLWATTEAKVNQFENGCLKRIAEMRGDKKSKVFGPRVCNSDDKLTGKNTNCSPPDFDYFEVRIGSGDWDESIMLGWVYQILLSEVVGVPATIEGGKSERDSTFSFYDADGTFKYPLSTYNVPGLVEASKYDGDCSKSDKICAHMMPTVWAGGKQDIKEFQDSGLILPQEQRNGVNVRLGFFIPLTTARRDPTLISYLGLQGEANRKKLAETFKTPTTWKEYCSLHESNCATGDSVIASFPKTDEEESSYFIEGLYPGYFRVHDDNNCTKNENTCTGHFVAGPCTWTNYAEAQMYWNNISLASQGPIKPNNGYTYSQMFQIYKAANATKSDVFFWWWTPEILDQIFIDSDYELHQVALPQESRKCIEYRRNDNILRCSDNLSERLGDAATGACDYEQEAPTKIMATGFVTATEAKVNALQSPAYELMKTVGLPLFPIDSMLKSWDDLRKADDVIDAEREGLCLWVYDNIDYLLDYVPKGYPRVKNAVTYERLSLSGYILGSVAMLAVILSFSFIYKNRTKREIKYAQVDALLMTTIGYGCLAISAITSAIEPTNVTCVLTQWFMRLGYTISMVPILIKISAINKLTKAGLRFKRAEIDHSYFKKVLALTVSVLLLYLALWTLFDMFRQGFTYSHIIKDNDVSLINIHNSCASTSNAWEILAFGFEAMLLAGATMLTYQSRDVIEELNESRFLAFMVYSHFMYLLMRLLIFVLMLSDMIPNALWMRLMSLLVSSDTLTAILIYIGPKFVKVRTMLESSNEPRGVHISTRKFTKDGTSGHRNIPGIKMPTGGVPNLIIGHTTLNTQLSSKVLDTKTLNSGFSSKALTSGFSSRALTSGISSRALNSGFSSKNLNDNRLPLQSQNLENVRLDKKVAFDTNKTQKDEIFDSSSRLGNREQLGSLYNEAANKTSGNNEGYRSCGTSESGSEEELDLTEMLRPLREASNSNSYTTSFGVRPTLDSKRNSLPYTKSPLHSDETENPDNNTLVNSLRSDNDSLRDTIRKLESFISANALVESDDKVKDSETKALVEK